jgi:hypothetical protein
MAFPLPRGITPSEIGFLAEMEMVTVVPRQRLEGLELLGVSSCFLYDDLVKEAPIDCFTGPD